MPRAIILKDASIANIFSDGTIELFPSNKWKTSGMIRGKEGGKCHKFKLSNSKQAYKILDLINDLL
mgnify:CR=1 FL=1